MNLLTYAKIENENFSKGLQVQVIVPYIKQPTLLLRTVRRSLVQRSNKQKRSIIRSVFYVYLAACLLSLSYDLAEKLTK
jgi:activator of 2-hydroxyglutaryl-CoA dehydratase